jgi:hypothetical protein
MHFILNLYLKASADTMADCFRSVIGFLEIIGEPVEIFCAPSVTNTYSEREKDAHAGT